MGEPPPPLSIVLCLSHPRLITFSQRRWKLSSHYIFLLSVQLGYEKINRMCVSFFTHLKLTELKSVKANFYSKKLMLL